MRTEVEQENAVTGANDSGPTFEAHIKSLFRERDRVAMLAFFDLWSFDDVKAKDLLERWVGSGTPR